ncbi:MAG TPA: ABC transporter ATP-binding protein [Trebonia sp.]
MTAAARGLSVEALAFAYPRQAPVLTEVSFGVEPGQVCCLLGPNGAGKTSLIRCLVGLARPGAGTVRIDGEDVTNIPPPQLARRVAYLPQTVEAAFAFTASDVVATGRTAYVRFGRTPDADDLRVVRDALEQVGIGHLADRPFNRLSGGERQLCGIARALAQETPVVIFDEPTSALDYGNQVRVLEIVRGLAGAGKAVLMTSHAPNQALEACQAVVLLHRGRVMAAGEPAAVIDGPSLTALYGVPVSVSDAETPFGTRRVCVPEITGRALTQPGNHERRSDDDPPATTDLA